MFARSHLLAMVLALAPAVTRAQPHMVTIPAGTRLVVRLDERLSTKTNRKGGTFTGHLETDVAANGAVVLPRGTQVFGTITESKGGVRFGQSELAGTISALKVNGQLVPIVTDTVGAKGKHGGGLARVGAGTIVGAALGGAALGAAVGGTAAVLHKGSNLEVPQNTLVQIALRSPVTIRQ